MKNKHFVGIDEGDAVAAFVSQVEQKTGKTLKYANIRYTESEPVRYATHADGSAKMESEKFDALESSLILSLEFFPNQTRPPDGEH